MLDALGGGGESLGVQIKDRTGAEGEQDGTNERGNDDDYSIA